MLPPLSAVVLMAFSTPAQADPCGMVPPIRVADGDTPAIQRTGPQRTYVMFKDGVETMALRPGFTGEIDDFGMLIPFPSPPALRKIDDETFAHIEAAIDPPQLTIEVRAPVPLGGLIGTKGGSARGLGGVASRSFEFSGDDLRYNEVRVVNQEAVGMYQVAVLEAGSPKALRRWMAENEYRYPDGMDDTVQDYVKDRWVFVAIKATVGQAKGVSPTPGMRSTNSKLPPNARFDGHVQGMGFRFETDAPVVPMRLSVFNPDTSGDGPRNVVYMLAEKPMRIDDLNTDLVVRQVQGNELHGHLTQPLDLVWTGGDADDVQPQQIAQFDPIRAPAQYNRIAAALFADDLLAIDSGTLSLPHEETEKELLRISESLGLRGAEMDKLHGTAVTEARASAVDQALGGLKEMALTVIDGQFPTSVLAAQNLEFSAWRMAPTDNTRRTDALRPADLHRVVYKTH